MPRQPAFPSITPAQAIAPPTQRPPHGEGTPMSKDSSRSLRRAYLEWVEEQVEDFKDTIPRSRLLAIADQVVDELRLARGGQYQLTEVLLCDAMNRHLFKLLKLPGYRAWLEERASLAQAQHDPRVILFRELSPPPSTVAPRGMPVLADEDGPLACVG